jgi:hypothetical protein
LEFGEEFLKNALTFERRRRIPVVEASVIGRDNFIFRLDHLGIDEALNAVLQEVGMINRLH